MQDAAIVFGLFRREIGDENAIGSGGSSGSSKFLHSELQDGIEITEEDQRHLAALTNRGERHPERRAVLRRISMRARRHAEWWGRRRADR